MTKDPWHFKRSELADRVLSVLTRGPAQALSLFAPRPFSRDFRAGVGTALGEEVPTEGRVQAALRRLGIVDTAGGDWGLADPGFGVWIMEGVEG